MIDVGHTQSLSGQTSAFSGTQWGAHPELVIAGTAPLPETVSHLAAVATWGVFRMPHPKSLIAGAAPLHETVSHLAAVATWGGLPHAPSKILDRGGCTTI